MLCVANNNTKTAMLFKQENCFLPHYDFNSKAKPLALQLKKQTR